MVISYKVVRAMNTVSVMGFNMQQYVELNKSVHTRNRNMKWAIEEGGQGKSNFNPFVLNIQINDSSLSVILTHSIQFNLSTH